MKIIEVTEKEVRAAFDVAKSDEVKKVLAALFCKPENKPNLDDYKTIKSYEDACEVLGEKPILNETTRMMYNNLENLIGEFPKHIIALMKLETVSRALWGKDFQPKPDAEGYTWYYYPWFALYTKKGIEGMSEKDKGTLLPAPAGTGASAGFGSFGANSRSSASGASVGFRLCQETIEKAVYFGQQFIELWAEYLDYGSNIEECILDEYKDGYNGKGKK